MDENWTPAVARRLNAGGHVVERREKHFQSVLRLSRVHSVNFLGSLSLMESIICKLHLIPGPVGSQDPNFRTDCMIMPFTDMGSE